MQQFTVPQFIDVEDKIIGPITARQFIIMLAGSLIVALFYKLFDFTLFLISGVIAMACCGVLAFIKINGMPFHFFILNFFQTFSRANLRIWDNTTVQQIPNFKAVENSVKEVSVLPVAKRNTASRLSELSLIVDTHGAYRGQLNSREKAYSEEDFNNNQPK
ncbi:MAG: PrgI family protein [Patescibacteria group bacterium]|nr:PrgI family protein [Patescibacteria group bacterium]